MKSTTANPEYPHSSTVAELLFGEVRRVSTVLQSLHSLKYYYWAAEEKDINLRAKCLKLRPGPDEMKVLRAYILSFICELIVRSNTAPLDETQGMLNYLSSCSQPENLLDVLETISGLLIDFPNSMVPALDQKNAIKVIFSLIGSVNEQVRITSIRLLSLFLSQCSYKKKQEIMSPHNLFMLLCDRLRAYRPITLELYEALMDLVFEENDLDRKLDADRSQAISKKEIVNSTVIKVIATLIHEERSKSFNHNISIDHHETNKSQPVDIRRVFINDLWNLIVNSRENRRIILQMSVWQHWLINLSVSTVNDSPLVRDQILAIFRVLLYHAMRYEYGGWRVWIDSLAIIHAKVSFDEFCSHVTKGNHSEKNHQQAKTDKIHITSGEVKSTPVKVASDSVDSVVAAGGNRQQDARYERESAKSPKLAGGSTGDEASPSKQSIVVSSISERVLNESRGIEMDDEDTDDQEKGLEQNTTSAQSLSDDLRVETSGEDKSDRINEETPDATQQATDEAKPGIDSTDLAPSRAYRKKSCSEAEEETTVTTGRSQPLSEQSSNELDRQQSLTSIPLDESSSPTNEGPDGEDDHDIGTSEKKVVNREIDEEPNDHQDEASPDEDPNSNEHTPQQTVGSNSGSCNKAQASPAFRIPEFRWGAILVKLLNDLVFSIECDLYHWRCIASSTNPDAIPFAPKTGFGAQSSAGNGTASSGSLQASSGSQTSSTNHIAQIETILQKEENQTYIVNIIHLVCQLSDNVIIAAGGLLPLLADATGGSRSNSSTQSSSDPSNSSMSSSKADVSPRPTNIITSEGLTLAQANSLLYRLAAMFDMTIFAAPHVNLGELEVDKNTTCGCIIRQCLRLACTVTVKNCLILRNMHSKLKGKNNELDDKDISSVEFPKEMFDSYQGCSLLSANGLFEQSALTLDKTDLIASQEYSPHQNPNTSSTPSILPFQTCPIKDPNKLLQPLDICRIQSCIYRSGSPDSRLSQFLALSSLYFISVLMVSKYRDIIEPKHRPQAKFKNKDASGSDSISASTSSAASAESSAATGPQPANGKSGLGGNNEPISSVEANLLTFGKMQPNSSGGSGNANASLGATSTGNSLTNMLTSKLENTLDTLCPLLKSIMCDFSSFLSKTLLGSHGQDLVNKEAERTFKRPNTSPVELVMLLCSQEWQNTLQKNAGLAFIELINEGRVLSHGIKDHIVRVAMEAEFILSRLRADDVAKHEHFGLACSESLSARMHEEIVINSLISSAARRDFVLYGKFKESIAQQQWNLSGSYKLDIWEDDDRRKRRFVFDSWPNSTQSIYFASADETDTTTVAHEQGDNDHANDNNDTMEAGGVENSSLHAKTEDINGNKRILDLQRTIELGEVSDHCGNSVNRDDLMGATFGEDNFDPHDESMYDEDLEDGDNDEEEQCDSNSPHSGSIIDSSAASQRRHSNKMLNKANFNRAHHSLNMKNPLGGASSGLASSQISETVGNQSAINGPNGGDPKCSENMKQQHLAAHWEYEDYGTVNDLTGSVIYAAEASLVWSAYAIPGVLQITTHELYFEPNQNIGEMIDSLKYELQQHRTDSSKSATKSELVSSTELPRRACQRHLSDNHQEKGTLATRGNTVSPGSSQSQFRKADLLALRYCDFLTVQNGKIQLADIRAIFSRHYLLQPNGLEIFVAQRTSFMFAFNDFDTVRRMVKYLPPVGVGIKYGIGQSRRASLMSPKQLFAASNMTQRWQRREIGNFQYLMFLNTIAGRTYQDLNQYPVFPWILTNYESEELDLSLPTNFRDLSKPVGALNSKRRDDFIERYQTWDNPKVPAFHYGTHYSTAAFTLNWLCRLRGSFNSSYLALQDGKYEDANRLFVSVGDSWVSSLVGGQQNVKELIPEFFYLPEMFHANLGLPEVELPPWSKGSPEQFVRMHRIALESELVSCQLHQWIDLIFGYKQRGPEAINSVNTFYYLTYQGNVNLNMIKDQALREAIETQIKHFGQTPSQLTTEPHPPRFSALHASPMTFNSSTMDEINKVVKFPFNNSIVHISSCINNYISLAAGQPSVDSPTTGTVQQAAAATSSNGANGANSANSFCPSSVLTITGNLQYQIHKWRAGEQSGHPFTLDPQLEGSAGSNAANRRQLIDIDDLCSGITLKLSSSCSDELDSVDAKFSKSSNEIQWPCAHFIVTLNGKYIIMGSFYDNTFRVFTTESGKLCQVIYGHRAPITCIVRSEGNAVADFFIATGSQDCSLLVWFWNERYAQVEGAGVSPVHNPLPKLTITGHTAPVLSALISAELGLVISGSKNLILVHTTTTGESLLNIDVNLSKIYQSLDSRNGTSSHGAGPHLDAEQRPQVKDKQKTILEASMLGDPKDQQRLKQQQQEGQQASESADAMSNRDDRDSSLRVKTEQISQLSAICASSEYYVTNLQLARELAFIVCVALPAPRKRLPLVQESDGTSLDESRAATSQQQAPALLLSFNLKGSLMDSVPIGLANASSSPKLGDTCVMSITRDGEHLILNDSPSSLKIYKTFGLQPVYAYNTNDINHPNSLTVSLADSSSLAPNEHKNRIRSLALMDQKFILVGLDNGKLIVYNCDFKNLQ